MSIVPKKYHTFISPPLRRVFLDAAADAREGSSRAVIKNLNAEIAALKERVTSLERNKVLLIDRYQTAQNTVAILRLNERTARLALEDKDKQNLNRLRAEYHALKSVFYSILFICFCLYETVLEITRSVGLL